MLLSIEEAFNEQDNKDVSLMVKILAVNAAKKSESGKNYTEVTIADSSGVANMKVFKQDEMQKFAELPSVILMNVIKKSNCFIFTVKSRASITAEINYKTTAIKTPEKKMTIKDMLTSKEKGTVICRIIKVSPVKDRTSQTTGLPLKLRHLLVKDSSGTAKAALWNDLATTTYETDDVIQLKDIHSTTYQDRKLLGTTATSSVEFVPDNNQFQITEDETKLYLGDPDFSDLAKLSAVILGYDNINIYKVCTNHSCLNKELIDSICPTCKKSPNEEKLYLRLTLTVQEDSSNNLVNLTMFYPEFNALCLCQDFIDYSLDMKSIKDILKSFLGSQITYNTRKTTICNVAMKRKAAETD